jgi:hypothetical protein
MAAGRGPLTGAWGRAAADARLALRQAEENLATVVRYFGACDPQPPDVLASQLDQAALFLAVGRDLMRTHFQAGEPSSTWSAAICSPEVTRALLNELGSWCRVFSPTMEKLSIARPRPPMPHRIRENLFAACRCLMATDLAIRWVAELRPVTASDRQLLDAVPMHVMPGRWPPYAGETVPQLCEGIVVSAERLRSCSRQLVADAHWSPLRFTTPPSSWAKSTATGSARPTPGTS